MNRKDNQLSAISYQLSAISYQLSAISYQLSAISYQLSGVLTASVCKAPLIELKKDRQMGMMLWKHRASLYLSVFLTCNERGYRGVTG
jgi:hypothetical protein